MVEIGPWMLLDLDRYVYTLSIHVSSESKHFFDGRIVFVAP